MVSSTVLTLAVIPAIYALVKSPRGAHRNVAIANEQTGGEPAVAAVR